MKNIKTACLLLSMLGVLTGCGGDDSSGGVKTVPVVGVDSGDKNDDNADVDSTVDDDTDTDTDTDTDLSIKFEVRHFLQMRMNILRWCSIPKPFAWACI